MNSNLQGNIGEAVAIQYFIEQEYEVYLSFGTATKSDLVVVKDNVSYRVSVKTTSRISKSGRYAANIAQGKLRNTVPFDPLGSDILFIYVIPTKQYYIFNSSEITNRRTITVG